ncbi:DNA cytosine methyltransferase [Synechocystis sp. PCC 7509]|uniref:DNA cytosine methyltransferase n=1 Tax=Synechocystis sp. PCC 7509 TaxID=927677 RepID=UPI0002FF976D|nr:DNA cytosine methyltransferase [Synechocystis sp. PCC 7509]
MSRSQVRSWDELSFTIQAGGRYAPIHPQASKMIDVGLDKWIFDPKSPAQYRKLTIRECARVQTFPDNFIFYYKNIIAAYKMIENVVSVNFSYTLAQAIKKDLFSKEQKQNNEYINYLPTQISLSFIYPSYVRLRKL